MLLLIIMSCPEQLDFFEKREVSNRQEPNMEEEEVKPSQEDESSRLLSISEDNVPARSELKKKIEKQVVDRMLDRLYRKLGARPRDPQEELPDGE